MIIFSADLKTHIKSIDEQHKELIDRINAFESIKEDSHTSEDIEKTLKFLGDYIVKHFTYEEGLMKDSNYPKYEWHKNWHQGYIMKYEDLKNEYLENGISENFAYILDEFIVKWIVRHIQNVDTELGNYIK
ncbi:MAG: hemerythrin family protein [Oscillospiraceae bacterium]|nr:hemerythrin family protein [Oscillospiraceae bacterium]